MKPKIYEKKEHCIEKEAIDPDALFILDTLREAGHECYLVGGGVRDLLLGTTPKDFDISTSARPEEIKRLFRNCLLIGRRFRLAHVRFGKKIFEVSTFRSGDNESDALIVRDNTWGSAEEDAMRRDFTINGLFYCSDREQIIDYVKGYPDAREQILRVIGNPYLRFRQDPVRMLRMIKFRARFGLDIDREAFQALVDCHQEIVKSAGARVLEEILRMLESGSAARFFHLLADSGLLLPLFPTLTSFIESDREKGVQTFLNAIDERVREAPSNLYKRPVLLGTLVFPSLHQRIGELHKEKILSLQEIQNITATFLDTFFAPFFRVPRRMKSEMLVILSSQYRMTPVERENQKRIRIPRTEEFPLAIDLLALRASIDPALSEVCGQWQSAYLEQGSKIRRSAPPKKRRSRGHRRRRKGEGRREESDGG